jgi:hypothetical protein
MRSRLHLSCFVGGSVLLFACGGREADRAEDDLPPPAPQVEPVPEVPPNPIVNVPRPNLNAPAPSPATSPAPRVPPPVAPAAQDDSIIRPAPPLDTRPSIPLDSIT